MSVYMLVCHHSPVNGKRSQFSLPMYLYQRQDYTDLVLWIGVTVGTGLHDLTGEGSPFFWYTNKLYNPVLFNLCLG